MYPYSSLPLLTCTVPVLYIHYIYVGGLLQTSGYAVTGNNPVTIEFDTAPTAGYQVTIQIRQGLGWYGAGSTTAYDGIGLQYTDTLAAQFFRG